jgi:hypothetical protein
VASCFEISAVTEQIRIVTVLSSRNTTRRILLLDYSSIVKILELKIKVSVERVMWKSAQCDSCYQLRVLKN